MIRAIFLISILSITMSYCEGEPKTTEANKSSVVFISDTVNNKIDVKINGALFTSYVYDKSLPTWKQLETKKREKDRLENER
jgi:hypothetical protein